MAGESNHILARPEFTDPVRVALIVAPYYKHVTDELVNGALAELDAAGATYEVIEVPGALEIAPAIRIAGNGPDFDGFVALGCVIRGETTHYDTVCNDSSRALTLLGLDGACIGNGILTVETYEQAAVRAEVTGQNKGGAAAAAALHLIALTRRFAKSGRNVGFRPDGLRLAGNADGPATA